MRNTTHSTIQNLGAKLGHIVIPMATPFKEGSQDVDFDAAVRLTDHIISNELCDSIIVGGTSGEFHALTLEERFELFRLVRDAAAGRVPIVGGCCSSSTRDTIALARESERLGLDALMVLGPSYCRPTQEGVYLHFAAVAQAVRVPIKLGHRTLRFAWPQVEKALAKLTIPEITR